MTRDSAIEGFISAVAAAVADREHNKPASGSTLLPLSGGRDSRHLLLRLIKDGFAPPRCVTVRYGRPNPLDEVTVASSVASRTGVRHNIVDAPRSLIRAESAKNHAIGFTSLMHAWYLSVVEAGRKAGVSTVYDGLQLLPFAHQGWADRSVLARVEAGHYESIARDWISRSALRFVREPFRGLISEERAIARLARELERFADWPNPLGAFVALNRTRRSIGNPLYRLWPSGVTVFCPFLDQRVFDHLLGLPAETTMLEVEDFHTVALIRAFPEYADIPFAIQTLAERAHGRDLFAAGALTWLLLSGGVGPILNPYYVFPRAIRAVVDPSYSSTVRWIGPVCVYLRKLGLYWQRGRPKQEDT